MADFDCCCDSALIACTRRRQPIWVVVVERGGSDEIKPQIAWHAQKNKCLKRTKRKTKWCWCSETRTIESQTLWEVSQQQVGKWQVAAVEHFAYASTSTVCTFLSSTTRHCFGKLVVVTNKIIPSSVFLLFERKIFLNDILLEVDDMWASDWLDKVVNVKNVPGSIEDIRLRSRMY